MNKGTRRSLELRPLRPVGVIGGMDIDVGNGRIVYDSVCIKAIDSCAPVRIGVATPSRDRRREFSDDRPVLTNAPEVKMGGRGDPGGRGDRDAIEVDVIAECDRSWRDEAASFHVDDY